MSSKRLAVAVAAGQAARAGPPGQQPLKGKQRPPASNLLIISAVLGAALLAACLVCWCCRGRRGRAGKDPPPPPAPSSVYTLAAECPHRAQCCESPVPPYRRPPTPGPPPAYDSVVSLSDEFRRFGNDEDYSDDIDKLQRYAIDDIRSSREIIEDSMSGLNKLRHCKIRGSCACYEDNREIPNDDTIRSDLGNDRHGENVEREVGSELNGNWPEVAGIQILIDIDRTRVQATDDENMSPNSNHSILDTTRVGQTDVSSAETGQLCSTVEPRRTSNDANEMSKPPPPPQDTASLRHGETCREYTTQERRSADNTLPSYEAAVTFRNKFQDNSREEGR